MKQFKKQPYKDFTIDYYITDEGLFYAKVLDIISSEGNTFIEVEKNIKESVDDFLLCQPKTYKELAQYISDSLTWTSYEDCYLDPKVCEIIVGNFIKLNSI